MPLYASGSSPYNRLLDLLGFQRMMSALIDEPEAVHAILERTLPRPSTRLAAVRRLGVGIMFVEECLASADLISPRMYDEFVFPYTRDTLQFYEDQGFRTVLYFSGNLMPLLERLRELPFTALSFEEDRKNYGIDLAEVRRVMGADRVLFGNVDAHFLEKASDEEVLSEVRRQIDVAGSDGSFVLSVGSPITPGTPLDRVRLFCESTRLI
jgi:uroporphyrinogen decarboxylase